MNIATFGVQRPVAANLVMFAIIVGGVVLGLGLRREFFPEIRPNEVVVTAPYPGASPDEIEESLAIKIEDRIADLDDIVYPVVNVANRFDLIKETSVDEAVRAAASEQVTRLGQWFVGLQYREGVYKACKAFEDHYTQGRRPRLAGEDRKLFEETMRDYRRAGMHLDLATRNKVEELQKQLTAVSIDFGNNITNAQAPVEFTAAELAGKLDGGHMALDISERSEGYEGVWKRVPVGPCGFITPFNFPLNLVAHKVAPAIAVGAPFVLKPASNTPLSALMLGGVLAETALPPGGFSIIPCGNEDARAIVEDPRLRMLSFTGSQTVGWELRSRAGKKRVARRSSPRRPASTGRRHVTAMCSCR